MNTTNTSVETRTLDEPLSRGDKKVSLSAFSFLFSEIVQYTRSRVRTTQDLELRLEELGQGVGSRILELACLREKPGRRETRMIGILQFIHTTVWTVLFDKAADELQRSTESEDEYMINEADTLVNKFISVPRELGALNCAAFVAGVIKGVLDAAGFPARVNAHSVPIEGQPRRTMFLIKLEPEVLERERLLG